MKTTTAKAYVTNRQFSILIKDSLHQDVYAGNNFNEILRNLERYLQAYSFMHAVKYAALP